jgi:hypothetical protein
MKNGFNLYATANIIARMFELNQIICCSSNTPDSTEMNPHVIFLYWGGITLLHACPVSEASNRPGCTKPAKAIPRLYTARQ